MVKFGWLILAYRLVASMRFIRPAIIVQSDELNKTALNTVLVIAVTSNLRLADYSGNVFMSKNDTSLKKDSVALSAQIVTIDKKCLVKQCGKVPHSLMQKIDDALRWSLALP